MVGVSCLPSNSLRLRSVQKKCSSTARNVCHVSPTTYSCGFHTSVMAGCCAVTIIVHDGVVRRTDAISRPRCSQSCEASAHSKNKWRFNSMALHPSRVQYMIRGFTSRRNQNLERTGRSQNAIRNWRSANTGKRIFRRCFPNLTYCLTACWSTLCACCDSGRGFVGGAGDQTRRRSALRGIAGSRDVRRPGVHPSCERTCSAAAGIVKLLGFRRVAV